MKEEEGAMGVGMGVTTVGFCYTWNLDASWSFLWRCRTLAHWRLEGSWP